MIAASFDESNAVLGPPEGQTEEEVHSLSVLHAQYDDGTPVVFSCWKLTQEEIEEFNRTGRIWLGVIGTTMPPVNLTANKPFTTQ